MSKLYRERVLHVHHWTDTLFSFATTRDASFRFVSGQFVMIGLEQEGKALLRAYSLASAHYEDHLEFLSIKVPDGPLTSRLMRLQQGAEVLIGRKATGTLVQGSLLPGRRLYLIGTGTGLAPFLSLIRDPETYERHDRVVLVHGCRYLDELAYRRFISEELPQHELLGQEIQDKLIYYPSVTREPFATTGRVTELIRSGRLFSDLDLPPFDPCHDRIMLCGSPAMLAEMRDYLDERGFLEGSHSNPGDYVFEKAFAER